MMHFGATLKLLRVDAGMSLRRLAREVGVSSAYLSRVENGHDPAPTPERLVAIADALEMPGDLLVELANQTGPALAAYIERVPAASAFFLEVARRNLDATQLARLRELMDDEIERPDPRPATRPSLRALIGRRVLLGLECTGIEDIINAGSELCATRSHSAETIASLIRERELTSPTILGNGVAVPHAIIPGAHAAACLVVPSQPLSLAGPDVDPIKVAFVLVSGAGGHPHLDALAQIARLTSHGIADELRGAATARRALAAIKRAEAS